MDFITVTQFAQMHEISERTVRNWCSKGKIQGAFLSGKTWNIPVEASAPRKSKVKESPLLQRLREEKNGKISGGIYHRTQIDLTYNSNHIEGSRRHHYMSSGRSPYQNEFPARILQRKTRQNT